jgi:hypothetical protein
MNTFSKLKKLFTNLKIKNPTDYANYIIEHEDYKNLSNFLNDNLNNNSKNNQHGGNSVDVMYKGIKFIFQKYKDENDIIFALYANNDAKNNECITIKLNVINHDAIIMGLGYFPHCFSNEQIKHFKGKTGGSLLLQLALKLIYEVKDHYNIKTIKLQDISHKFCHNKNIELSMMYILMYGHTWYGKYGFLPSDGFDIDDHKINLYNENKKIMKNKKMQDIPQLKKYLEESYEKFKNDKNIFDKKTVMNAYQHYYDENKKLSHFIQLFLQKFDKTCLLFIEFYKKLFYKLKLTDFYRQYYIKKI